MTRCPTCGYTLKDAKLHGDHWRCKDYPFFAHEKDQAMRSYPVRIEVTERVWEMLRKRAMREKKSEWTIAEEIETILENLEIEEQVRDELKDIGRGVPAQPTVTAPPNEFGTVKYSKGKP